jgi:hypothetical protein
VVVEGRVVSEIEKRGWPAFDRIFGAAAAAGATVWLSYALGPEAGSIVGNSTAPVFEEMSHAARDLIMRRFGRVTAAVDEAINESGLDVVELVRRSLVDDKRATLMSMALQAAADAEDGRKVGALGRAYARGVIAADDAHVDEQKRIVATLADLDPIDVRVLDRMTERESWLMYREDSQPHMQAIVDVVPGVQAVIDSVASRLTTLGLISDSSPGGISWGSSWRVTQFGRLCMDMLREIGESEPQE